MSAGKTGLISALWTNGLKRILFCCSRVLTPPAPGGRHPAGGTLKRKLMDTELRRDYQRQIDGLKKKIRMLERCCDSANEAMNAYKKLANDRGKEVIELKQLFRENFNG